MTTENIGSTEIYSPVLLSGCGEYPPLEDLKAWQIDYVFIHYLISKEKRSLISDQYHQCYNNLYLYYARENEPRFEQ
jgi:hypothetical protein